MSIVKWGWLYAGAGVVAIINSGVGVAVSRHHRHCTSVGCRAAGKSLSSIVGWGGCKQVLSLSIVRLAVSGAVVIMPEWRLTILWVSLESPCPSLVVVIALRPRWWVEVTTVVNGVVVWWCGGVVVWWCGGVVVWWCGGRTNIVAAPEIRWMGSNPISYT